MGPLHVVATMPAAGCLKGAFPELAEQLLPLPFPRHQGPLGPIDQMEAWLAEQLSRDCLSMPPYSPSAVPALLETWFGRIESAAERLAHAPSLRLWMGRSTYDQVATGFLCALMRTLGALHHPIEVADLGALDADPERPLRLDDTHPDVVARAKVRWRRLSDDDIALHLRVWDALASDSPDGLLALIDEADQLPVATRLTLDLHVRQFPATRNGLSHWDELLLRGVAEAGPDVWDVWKRIYPREPNLTGELVFHLLDRLRRMAEAPTPLLSCEGRLGADAPPAQLALTEAGHYVLGRKVDALSLNPLDERIGGLRLQAGGLVLRRERGGKLVGG